MRAYHMTLITEDLRYSDFSQNYGLRKTSGGRIFMKNNENAKQKQHLFTYPFYCHIISLIKNHTISFFGRIGTDSDM